MSSGHGMRDTFPDLDARGQAHSRDGDVSFWDLDSFCVVVCLREGIQAELRVVWLWQQRVYRPEGG